MDCLLTAYSVLFGPFERVRCPHFVIVEPGEAYADQVLLGEGEGALCVEAI